MMDSITDLNETKGNLEQEKEESEQLIEKL